MEANQKTEVVDRSTALKPCPFCGSTGVDVTCEQPGGLEWWVRCSECGGATDIFDTEQEAVAAWNLRTPSERDEFAQILAGLKARGTITQEDVDRLQGNTKGDARGARQGEDHE